MAEKVKMDTTVRHGDITADVSKDGIVTLTVGNGPDPLDHEHIETDAEHVVRLYHVLSSIIEWGSEGGE